MVVAIPLTPDLSAMSNRFSVQLLSGSKKFDRDKLEPAFSVATEPEEAEALDELEGVARAEVEVLDGVGSLLEELAEEEAEEFVALGLEATGLDGLGAAGVAAGGAEHDEVATAAARRRTAVRPTLRFFKRSPILSAFGTELWFRPSWFPPTCGIPATMAMMPSDWENPRYSANYVGGGYLSDG